MAIQKNDNQNINAPKPIDNRGGKWESGVWKSYANIAEANAAINQAYRHDGLTVNIDIGGFNVEHVYRNGVTNNHLVPKGTVYVVGTGADMTSALNTLLAVSGISSITIGTGMGTSVIINGTLNAGAKTIVFQKGGIITGTGTIVGGIINAPFASKILDSTINLSDTITTDGNFWCEWYGAVGDNSTDNYTAIQKAATYICNNNVGCKNLRIGAGIFRIYKGINFFRDTNGNGDPEFVNFTFRGNLGGYEFTGNETVIRCMHSDNFAINIQKGKGFSLSDMCLEGTNQLNYNVNQAWGGSNYNLGVRSNAESPYAGLVLDAFGVGTSGANRYPGFESYYSTVVGNGGSTDGKIFNLAISGFYVGIILSPNFNTQNNEAHTFDSIWISNVRDGFVTTNSQERTVRCSNFKFWNTTHTCCRTNGYGASRGEVPLIDSWNIAGNVYQIFNLGGNGGYFPVAAINRLYAENFYWIGFINAIVVKFTDCHFAFTDIKTVAPSLKNQDYIYIGSSVHFDNCILITYNGGERIPYNIYGRSKFINCYISNPVTYPDSNWTYDMYNIEYEDCRFYCDAGFISNGSFESKGGSYKFIGSEIASLNKEYTTYKSGIHDLNSANYFAQYRKVKSTAVRRIPLGQSVVVTVSGNTATLVSGLKFAPPPGTIIYAKDITLANEYTTQTGLSVMRATSGNTCDRVINGMVSGTYDLYYIQINYINLVAFCDLSGTAITNAVIEGQTAAYNMGTGLKLFSTILQEVISSSAGSATISYNNNLGTAQGIMLSNYEYDEYGSSYCNPLNHPFVEDGVAFTTGAFYKNLRGAGISIPVGATNAVGWLCIKSGVKGSAHPPIFLTQNADGTYS